VRQQRQLPRDPAVETLPPSASDSQQILQQSHMTETPLSSPRTWTQTSTDKTETKEKELTTVACRNQSPQPSVPVIARITIQSESNLPASNCIQTVKRRSLLPITLANNKCGSLPWYCIDPIRPIRMISTVPLSPKNGFLVKNGCVPITGENGHERGNHRWNRENECHPRKYQLLPKIRILIAIQNSTEFQYKKDRWSREMFARGGTDTINATQVARNPFASDTILWNVAKTPAMYRIL
jgi:hypothetical protein